MVTINYSPLIFFTLTDTSNTDHPKTIVGLFDSLIILKNV